MSTPSRGQFLHAAALASATVAGAADDPAPQDDRRRFRYCLNTSTLQGYRLGITEIVEVAAKAGYQAIEPWLNQIQEYVRGGGSLADLRKRIADLGLTVESAIAFPQWLVDDSQKRDAAFKAIPVASFVPVRRVRRVAPAQELRNE